MCGIAGFIGYKRKSIQHIDGVLNLMVNRGPDFRTGVYIQTQDRHIHLLHARLSIIDLDKRSHQPFSIGSCTLVFNGEIYNYQEIRYELEAKGVVFQTSSDTEVLLRAYIQYGRSCVDHFEGMWAFAIYDENEKELFLSRDRFAEKPLYYMKSEHGFIFGSEVKYIQALYGKKLKLNYNHIKRYLVNGYKSLYKTGETFFEEIQEVPPATNVVLKQNLETECQVYWKPRFTPRNMTMDQAVDGFRHHFQESIRLRLRSDVPMAFCLSGGIDSSAIVSTAAKLFGYDVTTFSIIDSDERYNERKNIETTLKDLGCRHTIIDIPRENFLDRLKDLVDYHDAPLYTASYYIHSFLSEAISRQGFRVVCSGTAADELVTGYYDHFNLYFYEMRNSSQLKQYIEEWQSKTGRYVRNPYLKNPEMYFHNPQLRDHVYLNNRDFAGYLLEDFQEPFTETQYDNSLLRNRMMNEMFHEGTRVILHEDDLNSMKYSIENRSPFLDKNLFEFSYSIPTEYLIQKGLAKYVLRESMKGILNEQVRLDTRKVGFNASIHSLVDLAESNNRDYLLDKSSIYSIVDKRKIESLLGCESLPNSFSKFLFNFINVKMFLELHDQKDVLKDDQVYCAANE